MKEIEENRINQKEIAEEKTRLKKLLVNLSDAQLKANDNFIFQCAFMGIMLKHLSEAISNDGIAEKYENGGNINGRKLTPEAQQYNSMIKNYTAAMKQLNALLPHGTDSVSNDLLEEAMTK
jgi:hypothetical protein